MPPLPADALLLDFVERARRATLVPREELASLVRGHSLVAAVGTPAQVEEAIDTALDALRELPGLVDELRTALLDPSRPAFERLGVIAGLFYAAAPLDALTDELPAGYGVLDDWIIAASTKWTYVRAPDPAEAPALALLSQRVWSCLPGPVFAALAQLVGGMANERATLQMLPPAQVQAMLDEQLRRPAPLQFVVPPPPAPPRDPLAGWSTSAAGSHWGDGRGAMHFSFSDGTSVGMTRSGAIVGGP